MENIVGHQEPARTEEGRVGCVWTTHMDQANRNISPGLLRYHAAHDAAKVSHNMPRVDRVDRVDRVNRSHICFVLLGRRDSSGCQPCYHGLITWLSHRRYRGQQGGMVFEAIVV